MKWKIVKIRDIAIQERVIVKPDSPEAKERPYLGLDQIESQTGRILTYNSNFEERRSTTFAFNSNHVLYGKLRPYLNKVAVPECDGRCSTEIIPLYPNGVDRQFFGLLLRHDKVVSAAMSQKTGSRMPRTDMDVLMELEVPIPELIEDQRRIAARLKAQLAELEKARKAVEAQLYDVQLLETRTIEAFFSDIDTTPKAKIGDVAQTISGSTPARGQQSYWEPAEIPWVKTAEVAFVAITSTEESVSQKALQECSLTLLPPKTVLVAMYGQGKTRGQSAILEMAATTNQACFAILPNETWEPDFLYFWLKRSYSDLRTLSEDRGGNQANLNGALLNAFEVPVPEKNIQRRIIEKGKSALEKINQIRESCNSIHIDIQQIPNRLLAQAFEIN